MEFAAVGDNKAKNSGTFLEQNWERSIREYLSMVKLGKSRGFRVAIMYLPYESALEWASGKYDRPQVEFLRLQEQADILFTDPLPALKKSERNVFLKNDPIHLNSDGFDIVAGVIFKNLKQNKVIE